MLEIFCTILELDVRLELRSPNLQEAFTRVEQFFVTAGLTVYIQMSVHLYKLSYLVQGVLHKVEIGHRTVHKGTQLWTV